MFPRVALSLLDPARPESFGLLFAAVMLLGGAWMFLGILEDVVSSDPLVLAWKRCWRTLAYWLTAVGFAQALVWMLKMTLERARPTAMYDGADRFSFPSGHAASSIVLYGFVAFLLAHEKRTEIRLAITLLAAGLVGLIAFSRLYLGAHWLSDVLASLSLGTACAARCSWRAPWWLRHIMQPMPPGTRLAKPLPRVS